MYGEPKKCTMILIQVYDNMVGRFGFLWIGSLKVKALACQNVTHFVLEFIVPEPDSVYFLIPTDDVYPR